MTTTRTGYSPLYDEIIFILIGEFGGPGSKYRGVNEVSDKLLRSLLKPDLCNLEDLREKLTKGLPLTPSVMEPVRPVLPPLDEKKKNNDVVQNQSNTIDLCYTNFVKEKMAIASNRTPDNLGIFVNVLLEYLSRRRALAKTSDSQYRFNKLFKDIENTVLYRDNYQLKIFKGPYRLEATPEVQSDFFASVLNLALYIDQLDHLDKVAKIAFTDARYKDLRFFPDSASVQIQTPERSAAKTYSPT